MKKNILFSAIFSLFIFVACDSGSKKSTGTSDSDKAEADSAAYYVDKYVKEVESLQALSEVAKKGNTDFLENEFTERKEALVSSLSKIEENSNNLTDEMKSRKEAADKMKNSAEQFISGVLQGK